ncbi:hypothetical protein B0H13DRAFT_2665059 [Mycena leptocephala]|nr:hypothetical protein B0H13DRAFT_2665059 [Mycena leptocephala]
MASLTSQPPVPRQPAPSTGTPQTPTLIWDVCLPQSRSMRALKRYPHLCLLPRIFASYVDGVRWTWIRIADELTTLTYDEPSQYLFPAHTPPPLAAGLFLRRAWALLPPRRSVLMRAHRPRALDSLAHVGRAAHLPLVLAFDVPLRHSGWDLSSPRSSRWRSISPVRHLSPASPALGARTLHRLRDSFPGATHCQYTRAAPRLCRQSTHTMAQPPRLDENSNANRER